VHGAVVQRPSGCGKSTWLALVAALVAPSAGELTVAVQPLVSLKNIAADAWRASAIGFYSKNCT
jgi:putative ABC transport system ATP-binding protein